MNYECSLEPAKNYTILCYSSLPQWRKTLEHYILCSDDNPPLMNNELSKAIMVRSRLKNKFPKLKTIETRNAYKKQRNYCASLCPVCLCVCQFNNQYNICNLRFHLEDHGMVGDCNFLATAHGKGENDGAGGDVKNGVWRKVLQKKSICISP